MQRKGAIILNLVKNKSKKNLKGLSGIMLSFVIAVLLLQPAYAEESGDYVVDMDGLTSVEGGAVLDVEDSLLFGNQTVLFVEAGQVWKIGTLDLSRYSEIEIGYGCDQGVCFDLGEDSYVALTQNGATQNKDLSPKSDAQVIAKSEQLEVPYASWSADPQTITFEIASDYNGDVYLAYNMEEIEGRQDGIAVYYVRFVSESSSAPTSSAASTEEATPAPSTGAAATPTVRPTAAETATAAPGPDQEQTSSFPWLTVVLILIVLLLCMIAIIFLVKKKKTKE